MAAKCIFLLLIAQQKHGHLKTSTLKVDFQNYSNFLFKAITDKQIKKTWGHRHHS